ncbi:MAG: hypothetical protein M0Z91_03885 [Actinomycetota bacterium]|nr:hypothetical protein [Actinomycetota bacterium]
MPTTTTQPAQTQRTQAPQGPGAAGQAPVRQAATGPVYAKGQRVRVEPPSRGNPFYRIDGIEYPRVTSIKSMKASSFANWYTPAPETPYYDELEEGNVPVEWETRMALEAVKDHPEWLNLDLKDLYATAGPAAHAYKTMRGNYGTRVHGHVENYITTGDPGPFLRPEDEGAFNAFRAFWDGSGGVAYAIEATVFSTRYGYAGTIDCLARFPKSHGNANIIVDWKTSKSMSDDFALQQAAYVHADYLLLKDGTVYPLPQIETALCVQLRSTGKPSIYQYDVSDRTFRAFRGLLVNFHLSKDKKDRPLQMNRRTIDAVVPTPVLTKYPSTPAQPAPSALAV